MPEGFDDMFAGMDGPETIALQQEVASAAAGHELELQALVAAAETTLSSIDVALESDSPTQPFDIAAVELSGSSPTAATDAAAEAT